MFASPRTMIAALLLPLARPAEPLASAVAIGVRTLRSPTAPALLTLGRLGRTRAQCLHFWGVPFVIVVGLNGLADRRSMSRK